MGEGAYGRPSGMEGPLQDATILECDVGYVSKGNHTTYPLKGSATPQKHHYPHQLRQAEVQPSGPNQILVRQILRKEIPLGEFARMPAIEARWFLHMVIETKF